MYKEHNEGLRTVPCETPDKTVPNQNFLHLQQLDVV